MGSAPTKKPAQAKADDEYQIPINRTHPAIYAAGAVLVIAVLGIGIYKVTSGTKQTAKPLPSMSVNMEAEKAKLSAQKEHLELTLRAFEAADKVEQEKAAAAAAASAAAAAASAEAKTAGGGPPPEGNPGGAPPPPGKKPPSTGDLDDLEKLGNDTNSKLKGN